MPNVMTFLSDNFSLRGASRTSSPFTISGQFGFEPFSISSFAFRILSCEPSCSRWHIPIFVIIAMSGDAVFESLSISPKPDIPISITALSMLLSSLKSVFGRPISLLRFSSVFIVFPPADSARAVISFVVVLPTLPVMPMTFTGIFFR